MSDDTAATLAGKLREHRFTGYTDTMLADEIDLFRSGAGVARIGEAVAALEAVAGALGDTEKTLRTELAKLGVEWYGDAGERAWTRLSDEADFSQRAGETVAESAQRVFAQGEAFNRTLHALPDSQVLRSEADVGIYDTALSLLGHETDNARRVQAKAEAREQALQALNSYARDSGENLTGLTELAAPEQIAAVVTPAPAPPESVAAGGGPSDDQTRAAGTPGTGSGGPAAAGGPGAAPTPAGMSGTGTVHHGSASWAPGASAPAPTTGTVSTASTPRASTGPSAATTPATGVGGVVGAGQQVERQPAAASRFPGEVGSGPSAPQSGHPQQAGQQPTGQSTGQQSTGQQSTGQRTAPPAPGRAATQPGAGTPAPGAGGYDRAGRVPTGPGIGHGPGTGSAPPAGGPATSLGPAAPATPGGPAAPDQPLARGDSSGAAYRQPGQPAGFGGSTPGAGTGGRGVPVNDVGGGAAAMGAAGVAGALSGDNERKGRGVGRSAPGAARAPHELEVGDLPEEEERVRRGTARLGDTGQTVRDEFLERAVPGEYDGAGAVRRFGVEDTDLFGDERMVTPDVLGEAGPDGRR